MYVRDVLHHPGSSRHGDRPAAVLEVWYSPLGTPWILDPPLSTLLRQQLLWRPMSAYLLDAFNVANKFCPGYPRILYRPKMAFTRLVSFSIQSSQMKEKPLGKSINPKNHHETSGQDHTADWGLRCHFVYRSFVYRPATREQ